jgi:MarC family integral membrane protein
MTKFLGYVAGALLAILPIVNPLGAVPLVMTVAAHLPEEERLRQIRRACVYTFVMMAGFLLAGGLIMSFFGISVPGMRIAGGMIVASLGFQMLFPSAPPPSPRTRAGDGSQGRHRLHAARHARSRGRRHLCRDHEPLVAGERPPGLRPRARFHRGAAGDRDRGAPVLCHASCRGTIASRARSYGHDRTHAAHGISHGLHRCSVHHRRADGHPARSRVLVGLVTAVATD